MGYHPHHQVPTTEVQKGEASEEAPSLCSSSPTSPNPFPPSPWSLTGEEEEDADSWKKEPASFPRTQNPYSTS